MRIARARLDAFALPLRAPLETAHGALRRRAGFLLALEDASGARGFGEATPLAGFGTETPAACRAALEALARDLLARGDAPLDDALDRAEALAPTAPAARAALDAALHDLAARVAGESVATLLFRRAALARAPGAAPRAGLPVHALLAGASDDALAAGARDAAAAGFAAVKLKVGAAELERDLERAARVREAAGARVRLRLDANGAWKEPDALRALERLAATEPEFVEQPLAPGDPDAFARVRSASPVPLAADESVAREATALLERGAADLFVLKLPALGGLRAAARLAVRAQRAGLDIVVTSALDSSLGIAAAAQLAAALPEPGRACGLATAALLAADLAPPLRLEAGTLHLPKGPGLGVAPDAAALRRFATAAPHELVR